MEPLLFKQVNCMSYVLQKKKKWIYFIYFQEYLKKKKYIKFKLHLLTPINSYWYITLL